MWLVSSLQQLSTIYKHNLLLYDNVDKMASSYKQRELTQLMEKAELYKISHNGSLKYCSNLFRDKTENYYDAIISGSGIMEPYEKDSHGDPRSPINVHRLKGLFFNACVDPKKNKHSIYGTKRLNMQPTGLMDSSTRLYFADFYCVPGKGFRIRPHYVTVVMTTSGTREDKFCRDNLVALDVENNPFLCITKSYPDMYNMEALSCGGLNLEIYYTNGINILNDKTATLQNVALKSNATGKRNPKAKSPKCPYCNITSVCLRQQR